MSPNASNTISSSLFLHYTERLFLYLLCEYRFYSFLPLKKPPIKYKLREKEKTFFHPVIIHLGGRYQIKIGHSSNKKIMDRMMTRVANHWLSITLLILISSGLYFWKGQGDDEQPDTERGFQIFMNDSLVEILGHAHMRNFGNNLVDKMIDRLGIRNKRIGEVRSILRDMHHTGGGTILFETYFDQDRREIDRFQGIVGGQLDCLLTDHIIGGSENLEYRVQSLKDRLLSPETIAKLLQCSSPQYFHIWATRGNLFHCMYLWVQNPLQHNGSIEMESLISKFYLSE